MNKLFALKGRIQNYAWGGKQFIPNLLGVEPSGEKCAEYWLGAHVNAPSVLETKEGEQTLNTFLNSGLTNKLGYEIAEKFGIIFIRQWLVHASQHCAYSRQQDFRAERFGQVVISPRFQSRDNIGLLSHGRYDDNRNVSRGCILLESPAHLHAANTRQHHVQQYQIRRIGLDSGKPFFT